MSLTLQKEDIVRIPLNSTIYARIIDSASGSSGTSGLVGVGVVGSMIVGKTTSSTKDSHYINCFMEKITNPFTGDEKFFLTKRPGFETLNTPAAGSEGTAIRVWSGLGAGTNVISAFGLTNSTLYSGTNSLGTVTGVVVDINETLVGTTPTLLITTTGNKGYYYQDGGAITEITDGQFPSNNGKTITGGFVSLDGYSFIMATDGTIWNSDINSITSWTALGYISSNMRPDTGLGLSRYKNYIVAFGKESVEFFRDVGNAVGSPLKTESDKCINIGCVSQYAFKELADTLVWIGTTKESILGLYILDGLNAKKVSTKTIDGILTSINPTSIYLNVVFIAGKTYIILVSTGDGQTYVYCLEEDYWSEWTSGSVLWTHMCGIGSGIRYVYAVGRGITSGKVYTINPLSYVFTDDGSNYTMTVQTSNFDAGTKYGKSISKLWLVGDKDTTTNNVSVSWSDDDYQNFSTARTIDMSSAHPYLNACGQFSRRVFKLTQTNSRPLRLEGIEMEVKQRKH